MINFRAFDPPTVETFAAHWAMKARYETYDALNAFRHHDLERARWRIARAEMAVGVLYDVHHPSAYHLLKRCQLVLGIIEKDTR